MKSHNSEHVPQPSEGDEDKVTPPWEDNPPEKTHSRARDSRAPDAPKPQKPQSSTGFRAVHAPHATEDSGRQARVTSLPAAVQLALKGGFGPHVMWHFARALKAFERDTKCNIKSELANALALWWAEAKPNLPADADREEYLADLMDCCARAKAPLGSNPLANAIQAAGPLPKSPKYADRIARLKRVCRELQNFAGNGYFFLSFRSVSEIIENRDPYAAQKALRLLTETGFMECVEKGGPLTNKASRFQLLQSPP